MDLLVIAARLVKFIESVVESLVGSPMRSLVPGFTYQLVDLHFTDIVYLLHPNFTLVELGIITKIVRSPTTL